MYDFLHGALLGPGPCPVPAVNRPAAGSALRALREARDWSLADLAATTGVSIMALSYLERGARKPHKSTVEKVEDGLGLAPGTYARLLVSTDPAGEVAQLLAQQQGVPTVRDTTAVVVDRSTDAAVFEGYAEAQLEALAAVIDRLPAPSSNEYEIVVQSVVAQCLKAELLAANSWRVAVAAGRDSADVLHERVRELEAVRQSLLARLDRGLGARLDAAVRASPLPESVIAGMLGVSTEHIWEIRNGAAIPPEAIARVRAFIDSSAALGS